MITATVALEDNSLDLWSIYISEVSSGQSYNQTFFYQSSQLSAEWIVERPTVNGILSSLADFGQVTISNCTATVNGTTRNLGDFNFAKTLLMNHLGTAFVEVSNLGADGTRFKETYLLPS